MVLTLEAYRSVVDPVMCVQLAHVMTAPGVTTAATVRVAPPVTETAPGAEVKFELASSVQPGMLTSAAPDIVTSFQVGPSANAQAGFDRAVATARVLIVTLGK